jgi:prepilin-type N-terminal cleavage/methylation domain-containing protein
MMMLRTGNKPAGGFTLVEIMVTVAVLSLGLVCVYQSLFICLDTYKYCNNYLNVLPQANEKIWLAQNALKTSGPDAQVETEGNFTNGGKVIDWWLSYLLVDESEYLYQITMDVKWKEANRSAWLSRTAYARYDQNRAKE